MVGYSIWTQRVTIHHNEKIEQPYHVFIGPNLWFLSTFEAACQYDSDSHLTRAYENAIQALCAATMIIPICIYDSRDGDCGVRCLLLLAEPGLQCGIYRRLGLVRMCYSTTTNVSVEKMTNDLRACQTILPTTCYHDTDGNENYSISVI